MRKTAKYELVNDKTGEKVVIEAPDDVSDDELDKISQEVFSASKQSTAVKPSTATSTKVQPLPTTVYRTPDGVPLNAKAAKRLANPNFKADFEKELEKKEHDRSLYIASQPSMFDTLDPSFANPDPNRPGFSDAGGYKSGISKAIAGFVSSGSGGVGGAIGGAGANLVSKKLIDVLPIHPALKMGLSLAAGAGASAIGKALQNKTEEAFLKKNDLANLQRDREEFSQKNPFAAGIAETIPSLAFNKPLRLFDRAGQFDKDAIRQGAIGAATGAGFEVPDIMATGQVNPGKLLGAVVGGGLASGDETPIMHGMSHSIDALGNNIKDLGTPDQFYGKAIDSLEGKGVLGDYLYNRYTDPVYRHIRSVDHLTNRPTSRTVRVNPPPQSTVPIQDTTEQTNPYDMEALNPEDTQQTPQAENTIRSSGLTAEVPPPADVSTNTPADVSTETPVETPIETPVTPTVSKPKKPTTTIAQIGRSLRMSDMESHATDLGVTLPERDTLRTTFDEIHKRATDNLSQYIADVDATDVKDSRNLTPEQRVAGAIYLKHMEDTAIPEVKQALEDAISSGDTAKQERAADTFAILMDRYTGFATKVYRAGSEAGRSLAVQKMFVDTPIDAGEIISKAEKLKGTDLSQNTKRTIAEKATQAKSIDTIVDSQIAVEATRAKTQRQRKARSKGDETVIYSAQDFEASKQRVRDYFASLPKEKVKEVNEAIEGDAC